MKTEIKTPTPTPLLVPGMQEWSIEQVLAVYDLCQAISVSLMAQHKDELLAEMMAIDERWVNDTNQVDETNLELPF